MSGMKYRLKKLTWWETPIGQNTIVAQQNEGKQEEIFKTFKGNNIPDTEATWEESQNNVTEWDDAISCEVIEDRYTRDKNDFYDEGIAMKWADLFTLTALENAQDLFNNGGDSDLSNGDKNDTYQNTKDDVDGHWEMIEWDDPENNFMLVDWEHGTDKNNVYFYWTKIEWADPKSFVIVDDVK